jgi:hypothetical protein
MMDLQKKARVVMKLLTDLEDVRKTLHELDKTVSRLHNELTEEYFRLDDALNGESLKRNPVIKEMNNGPDPIDKR